ncbi:MAG TPA: cell division protein FtsL [Solirubrobacteraceae bacterium]|jgi:cell division protein FtsL
MSGGAVALPAPIAPLRRILEALRALPDARWLDRLLRGQGWIVLIGIALMGIVAMQVSLLKMNAGIGQSIEQAGSLERQNADLRAEVSKLSSEERIATVAEKNGLVMPDAGEVRYVRVRGEADARKAAAVMRAPDPVEETVETTATSAATTDPAAQAAPTPTSTSTESATPPAGTTAPATATPPAQQTAPAQQQPTATGTTSGATQAPAGTTAAAGQ